MLSIKECIRNGLGGGDNELMNSIKVKCVSISLLGLFETSSIFYYFSKYDHCYDFERKKELPTTIEALKVSNDWLEYIRYMQIS